ncbi:MAG: hypothetical protein ACI9BD_001255 [Candidatus Marinamargulisbacteria bacterium]|jgi:hypothetical protein
MNIQGHQVTYSAAGVAIPGTTKRTTDINAFQKKYIGSKGLTHQQIKVAVEKAKTTNRIQTLYKDFQALTEKYPSVKDLGWAKQLTVELGDYTKEINVSDSKGSRVEGNSSADAYIEALNLDDSSASTWTRLGLVGGGEVNGKQYSPKDCCVEALNLDNSVARTWNMFGFVGGGKVNGQQYSEKDCYIEALNLDDRHAPAWCNLGVAGGGEVNGQQYSPKDCVIKSLNLDDRNAAVWYNLGSKSGGEVNGQQYSPKDCVEKALNLNDRHPSAWAELGYEGGGKVKGKQYSRADCFVKSFELDPSNKTVRDEINWVLNSDIKFDRTPDPQATFLDHAINTSSQSKKLTAYLRTKKGAFVARYEKDQVAYNLAHVDLTRESSTNALFKGGPGVSRLILSFLPKEERTALVVTSYSLAKSLRPVFNPRFLQLSNHEKRGRLTNLHGLVYSKSSNPLTTWNNKRQTKQQLLILK